MASGTIRAASRMSPLFTSVSGTSDNVGEDEIAVAKAVGAVLAGRVSDSKVRAA